MTAPEKSSNLCTATIFPLPSALFSARDDAEKLRKAMKNSVGGFGCDKQVIVDILTSRGVSQRLDIATAFKTMYGRDITEAFEKHLSGDFQRVTVAMMTALDEYYAKELHWALSGPGTSENTLIEILCTINNAAIRCVTEAYKRLYGRTLEHDLKEDTSFYFQRLLVSISQGNRDESVVVNMEQVNKDAQQLYDAGVARWGTDETVFNAVMVSRSYRHLREVFKEYCKIAGHDIAEAISAEFSGDIRDAHLTIVKCVKCRQAYFAERLHWSMKGLGTNERTLIRIIITRCETDLEEIKQKFEEKYEGTLKEWIKSDTSGYFKKTLLKLIGES